jgi:hypothetical protein
MLLTKERLNQYRAETFHTRPGTRLASPEEAVEYVNQRGYIFFWPIKGITMPSLWVAAAGDRPVPDEHDDPGHITWGWKDSLLGKRRWYYGRVLRKRNMMISIDILPYFYALSPNYGDPNEDYLIDYEAGRLTAAARNIYEVLLHMGPQDTIALRKQAGLTSPASDTEFNRALDELQTTFRILPVGISEAGAWHYSFIYEIVPRHFPDLLDRAHPITEPEARQKLLELYLASLGAVSFKDMRKLFSNQPMNWPAATIERDLARMEERGILRREIQVEGMKEPGIVIAGFLNHE